MRKVASAASLRLLRRYFAELGGPDRRGARRTQVQRNPGYGDVAVDEGLAGHAVAGGEVGLRQVLTLLFLDRVGVLETAFDLAFAGAAQAGAALERNPALFADRQAQQVACLGRAHDLVLVRDEGDADRHSDPRQRHVNARTAHQALE